MPKTQSKPWFVAEKRARKADRIARHLDAVGVDAPTAAHFADHERREAESAAGVPAASDETWRSVVEMLAGSVMPGALCRTCGIGDPEGAPGPRKPHQHPGPCSV